MIDRDWASWHEAYEDPASGLSRRLSRVQHRVREALDAAPPGEVRVLSMCAGQGRDLVEPLVGHPRRTDVRALLVELDPHNVAAARARVAAAGLDGVEVCQDDAARAAAYAAVVPVHLALVCGVLGNMTDDDVERTVRLLPTLVAQGGRVVWTRHTGEPDLTPSVRRWLAAAGFRELAFDTEPGYRYSVGTHVLAGVAQPFRPEARLFTFRAAFTPDETVRRLE